MPEKILITIHTSGDATIAAYCLKTDSWYDYLAFKLDAKQAKEKGESRNANRYLRAALVCLFSHLEGFVNDVENLRVIPTIYIGRRLCDRTRNVANEAKKVGNLPYLNFRLGKHLRDLIAHPGIEIDFSEEFDRKLDTVTIFEHLDLSTLETLEAQISSWIDAVCRNLGVPRFTDTEQLVTKIGKSLGEVNELREV